MTDTTNTADSGAGAPAPKSDAEAHLQQTQQPASEPTAEQQAEQAEQLRKDESKKNRTRDYIGRLQNDNADLRRRLADLETRSQPRTQHASPVPQQQTGNDRPTLADHGFDFNAWQQADTRWVEQQAERHAARVLDQRAQQQQEQALWGGYEQRAAQFANDHEDFFEVVGSMPALPMELQGAIARHPNGPAIAYHLGNNLSELIGFAGTPPQFADYALSQLAARLSAAPAVQPPLQAPAPKPITQAPPPVPMVRGRSATETPAEKLTDDDWYAKDRERRRKR